MSMHNLNCPRYVDYKLLAYEIFNFSRKYVLFREEKKTTNIQTTPFRQLYLCHLF